LWYYKIVLWYNGTEFLGFQKQKTGRTIGFELEKALAKIAGAPVRVTGAGRTDSGVHAFGQVISCGLMFNVPPEGLKKALNGNLPGDIRVRNVTRVEEDFHARKSAVQRHYSYLFSNNEPPMYLYDFVTKISFIPQIDAFPFICAKMLGTHDFSGFQSTGSDNGNPLKTISEFSLEKKIHVDLLSHEEFEYFEFKISANSFLYHMVRHIMGALFEVFREKQEWATMCEMLETKSRIFPNTLAPAKGLCLVKVEY
jgi:tRNA pseudouridine38-40 synthase